jgi:hypothetical protein
MGRGISSLLTVAVKLEKLQPAEQQANRKQTIFEVAGEIYQKLIWLTLNVNILALELKNISNFLGDFSPPFLILLFTY